MWQKYNFEGIVAKEAGISLISPEYLRNRRRKKQTKFTATIVWRDQKIPSFTQYFNIHYYGYWKRIYYENGVSGNQVISKKIGFPISLDQNKLLLKFLQRKQHSFFKFVCSHLKLMVLFTLFFITTIFSLSADATIYYFKWISS